MLSSFPSQLKQTGQDLLLFFKDPQDVPGTAQSTASKSGSLLQVLVIDILITVALIGLLEFIEKLGWYNSDNHAVGELMRSLPVWAFLLLGIVVVPFFEELVFRYGLRFSRGYLSFLAFFVSLTLVITAAYLLPPMWVLGVAIILAALLILYFMNAYRIGNFLERVWPGWYRVIFYTSTLLFGLVHITNFTDFDYSSAAVLLVPILIAPQVLGGFLMGYMRVKHGFKWGYFLHVAHNAFFFITGLLFMSELDEKLNINNQNYSLKIEEHTLLSKTTTRLSSIGNNTIAFTNQNLRDVISMLLEKEQGAVEYEQAKHRHTAINITYKNHKTDTSDTHDRKIILGKLKELYKFDITTVAQEKERLQLAVEDTAKLAQFAVEDKMASTVQFEKEAIILDNVTLQQLLSALESEFKITNKGKATERGKYNFKLQRGGLSKIKKELYEKYGLLVESKMILTEQAIVAFKD